MIMANSSNSLPENWYAAVEYATVSDIGMRRFNNQDAYTVVTTDDQRQWRRRGHLFVVADGMGAHAAGEHASRLAVENVADNYQRLVDPSSMEPIETTEASDVTDVAEPLDVADAIEQSIIETNLMIHFQGHARPDRLGMGTTCSALLLVPAGAVVAHVGDSRVYRLRHDQIEQLTFDHSLVWEMMAANGMTEDQIPLSVPKNVITRSLGPNPRVEVDLEGPFPVQLGDRYLLCSDGLTGLVQDAEIGALLAAAPVAEAAQTLVDLAKLRGGNDNITVIAVQVGPRPTGDAASPLEVNRDRAAGALATLALASLAVLCICGMVAGLVLQRWGPAALCLLGAAALATLATMAAGRGRHRRRAVPAPATVRRGRGPHRVTDCRATRHIIESVAESVRNVFVGNDMGASEVEREGLHDSLRRVEARLNEGDWTAALIQSADTIRAAAKHLHREDSPPREQTDFRFP